ncbi:hypothetical protein MTO96_036870 [Rhipicephalus appendiculatus]
MSGYCHQCRRKCTYCVPPAPKPRQQASTQTDRKYEFSLSECLDSGDLADVEILVDCSHFPGTKATFKAHKMILAVQNEVFRAMFYGDFAKEDRVVITDLHPEGVHGLLRQEVGSKQGEDLKTPKSGFVMHRRSG